MYSLHVKCYVLVKLMFIIDIKQLCNLLGGPLNTFLRLKFRAVLLDFLAFSKSRIY